MCILYSNQGEDASLNDDDQKYHKLCSMSTFPSHSTFSRCIFLFGFLYYKSLTDDQNLFVNIILSKSPNENV